VLRRWSPGKRLRILVDHNLLSHDRYAPGHGVYIATRKGLRFCELELAPARVSLGVLRHDLAAAGFLARLESELPSLNVLAEREIRQHVHVTTDQTYRPIVMRRGVRDARHRPDLAINTRPAADPGWIAVEVELTQKSAERTRATLDGYSRANLHRPERRLIGVLYVVPDAAQAARIQRAATEVGSTTYAPMGMATTLVDGQESPLGAVARLVEASHRAEAAAQALARPGRALGRSGSVSPTR
jgi:hypothetical protein